MKTYTCKKCGVVKKYWARRDSGTCYLCSRNLSGTKANNWNGGVTFTDGGYKLIHQPDHPFSKKNGYVLEHRLVMEKHLGRYLQKDEIVHHKDRDRLNNRVDNLVLTTQKEHMRKHHIRESRFCTLCPQKHMARGYCGQHYWVNFLKKHRFEKNNR